MGRMHSKGYASPLPISIQHYSFSHHLFDLIWFDCSKGISSSALPYKRTSPSWLKISSPEVTNFTLIQNFDDFLLFIFWICFRLMRLFASLLRRVWLLLRSVLFFVILTALLRSRALPAAKSSASSKLMVSLYALCCFALLGLVWINEIIKQRQTVFV